MNIHPKRLSGYTSTMVHKKSNKQKKNKTKQKIKQNKANKKPSKNILNKIEIKLKSRKKLMCQIQYVVRITLWAS